MDGSEEYGAERGCGDAGFYKRSSAGKARETPGINFCFKKQHIRPTARAKRIQGGTTFAAKVLDIHSEENRVEANEPSILTYPYHKSFPTPFL